MQLHFISLYYCKNDVKYAKGEQELVNMCESSLRNVPSSSSSAGIKAKDDQQLSLIKFVELKRVDELKRNKVQSKVEH